MKFTRRFLRIALVLALLISATSVLATGRVSAGPAQSLPDIEQVPPYFVFAYGTRGEHRKMELIFGSAAQNVGAGRLVIAGHRPSTAYRLMIADQLIDTADSANPQKIPRVGVLRYTRSPGHQHWHFLGFMRYELRRATNFRRVGRDKKTGFCLGDRYSIGSFSPGGARAAGPGPVTPPAFDPECGPGRPDLLGLTEGISPGKGDDYQPALEGQLIDISKLRSGRYILVHRSNVGRRIRESSYANNVASALLRLTIDPRGRRQPRVSVLKTCWATARCR